MENKAAKELWKQPIQDTGSFTSDSKTATGPSFITTAETTTIAAKYNGTVLQFLDSNNKNNELVFEDTFARKVGYTGRAPDGTFVRRCQQKLGNGLNVWYLYRTTPILDDQTPSFIVPASELAVKEKSESSSAATTATENVTESEVASSVATNDDKETAAIDTTTTAAAEDEIVNLYLYARIIPVRGTSGTASYVIYSTVKGIDTDCRESGAGFLWKDIYKVVKIPQFQYAALILDISEYSNKIVGKSQQTSALDVRPTFTLAAGVDMPAVIASCVPLLPEGSKVWLGASLASDLSGMLTAAL
ncbi:hypothetical protein FisN_1Lh058 [Fistulifera solaris]|uniref:Uncharacterized protein n=1 Tax=Fistulifera solaris TaxID=1519565 RepID=A0A1Z5JC44_FISSO|nr:hypothetical protein FisN_1Lh058 [Fistulifera solaris]|eukprot:GAX11580.1 hypothetical protein FisN_1Lh058 [Fistulifera solaris]